MAQPDPIGSLNERAAELVGRMAAQAEALAIRCGTGELGNREIDCGVRSPGSVEAGRRLAEVCLAGLAEVEVQTAPPDYPVRSCVRVQTEHPVLACLASQYAGWHFQGKAETESSSVLGSGPARALARREPIFDDIEYRDPASSAVLVLETDCPPAPSIVADAAAACAIRPADLTVLFAPTRSIAGSVQVAARVIECALQKARLLGFPVDRIVRAQGYAPLCPARADSVDAMGRTNDAIIYGGVVELIVSGPAADAGQLAESLPSRTSPEWGRSFGEVFRGEDCDFRAVDSGFFSPAAVVVRMAGSAERFAAGSVSPEHLRRFLA